LWRAVKSLKETDHDHIAEEKKVELKSNKLQEHGQLKICKLLKDGLRPNRWI